MNAVRPDRSESAISSQPAAHVPGGSHARPTTRRAASLLDAACLSLRDPQLRQDCAAAIICSISTLMRATRPTGVALVILLASESAVHLCGCASPGPGNVCRLAAFAGRSFSMPSTLQRCPPAMQSTCPYCCVCVGLRARPHFCGACQHGTAALHSRLHLPPPLQRWLCPWPGPCSNRAATGGGARPRSPCCACSSSSCPPRPWPAASGTG